MVYSDVSYYMIKQIGFGGLFCNSAVKFIYLNNGHMIKDRSHTKWSEQCQELGFSSVNYIFKSLNSFDKFNKISLLQKKKRKIISITTIKVL